MFKTTLYSIRKKPCITWFMARLPSRGILWVLATWGSCFLWIWPHVFVSNAEGIYAGDRCIWGDWAGHLAASTAFAVRPVSLWLRHHPLFYELPFNYPFISSLISGLMMRMGANRVSALVIPSIITTIFLLIALYLFYHYILKSEKQAYLAVTLFLLSGGLGFLYYLQDIFNIHTLQTVIFPIREYSFLEDKGIFFRNIIPGELLPQRSFLLGLPVGLFLLLTILKWFQPADAKPPSAVRCFLTGIPAGLMMIVHTHTYMVLVIICLYLSIIHFRHYKSMAAFALGAGLVSLWIFMELHGKTMSSRMFGWICGWKCDIRKEGIYSFVKFWIMNWGMILPLAMWGTIRMKSCRHPVVITGWLLFLASNVIRFQPWDWDNTKILTWSYLLLVIPVTAALADIWNLLDRRIGKGWLLFLVGNMDRSQPWDWRNSRVQPRSFLLPVGRWIGRGTVIVLIIMMTFSGGLEVLKLLEMNPISFQMWDRSKMDMADKLHGMLNPEETVLTDDDHTNWVSCLAGGQILMGFRGWLWSYGIDYSGCERDIITMYSGRPESEALFRKYHVRYVVLSPSARKNFRASEFLFAINYPVVIRDYDTRVYDVQSNRKKELK